ncbi:uncharacterized protein N7529_004230 [Penicillium soppii]|uniref:uncharacterized protein n=1 Tax=Penicillium soppii TaxID=69789 RepID=UPI0025486291|nr:uncharacterized protein N7529_004230 [Penicillium soppii]KAJ5871877.1 hypothetical protein N7529_004230 [Penicillium soppii]
MKPHLIDLLDLGGRRFNSTSAQALMIDFGSHAPDHMEQAGWLTRDPVANLGMGQSFLLER